MRQNGLFASDGYPFRAAGVAIAISGCVERSQCLHASNRRIRDNGVKITQKISHAIAGLLVKGLELPIAPRWVKTTFIAPRFQRMVRDGYRTNSAIFAIAAAYAFAFPEAPLVLMNPDGKPAPVDLNDPLQRLAVRPNAAMDWEKFGTYIALYCLFGGNCYLHKVRNNMGRVVELYPYHSGQMEAVPGDNDWVSHYIFTDSMGKPERIPAEEVIQLSFPTVDLEKPWLSMSPLIACAREADTDNEAARYGYALLKNDAVPQTVFSLKTADGGALEAGIYEKAKAAIREKFGGEAAGSAMVTNGASVSVQRIGLDLTKLGGAALRAVPEARMCAAFRIPAIVVGLTAGLDKATYANFSEARSMWTQNTLVPWWVLIAGELTHGLIEAGDGRYFAFDTSKVAALQTDANALSARVVNEWNSDLLTLDEARAAIGYVSIPGDGAMRKSEIAAANAALTALQSASTGTSAGTSAQGNESGLPAEKSGFTASRTSRYLNGSSHLNGASAHG